MRTKNRLGLRRLLFFAVSIAVVAGPVAAQPNDIQNLQDSWRRYLHDKQLDKAMDLYTEDAIFFEPDGKRATGKAEIRTLFSTVMKTFNSDIHFKSAAMDVSGGFAYASGDFDEVLTTIATGAKITSRGSYLMVLERQPGGKWKIAQHMWTQAASVSP
jgi:ketosteroid isomerase-like protein